MSHRDQCRRNSFPPSTQDLKTVISWLLAEADFGTLKSPKDGRWSLRGLVMMALLWVWSEDLTLTGRFSAVLGIAQRLWSKDVPQAISYQAFTKRLVRWTTPLLVPLQRTLRWQLKRSLRAHWRTAGPAAFRPGGTDDDKKYPVSV